MCSPRDQLLPIWLVKEYYWCPMSAYLALTLWRIRPTESMRTGSENTSRARIAELLEKRHRLREHLWEHPVASHRLGLGGRADLVAVTEADTLIVVEAKLPPLSRRTLRTRRRGILVQLAAYTVAAEETLHMPAEASYIYSTEADRLIPVRITPQLRSLLEHAAQALHEMAATANPPRHAATPRTRCRLCAYRHICPHSRA